MPCQISEMHHGKNFSYYIYILNLAVMRADTRHEIEFIIRLHEVKQHKNMNIFDRSKLWKVLLYAGAGISSQKIYS